VKLIPTFPPEFVERYTVVIAGYPMMRPFAKPSCIAGVCGAHRQFPSSTLPLLFFGERVLRNRQVFLSLHTTGLNLNRRIDRGDQPDSVGTAVNDFQQYSLLFCQRFSKASICAFCFSSSFCCALISVFSSSISVADDCASTARGRTTARATKSNQWLSWATSCLDFSLGSR
jgi:hypothetical protein